MARKTDWRSRLSTYNRGAQPLFDEMFLARWGEETWAPGDEDAKAASLLHIQLTSRIATQNLGYGEGVEEAALASIYALFEKTRDICEAQIDAHHFEQLAWHVLNVHVRPVTAKWHSRAKAGALRALDATDVFRAELSALQDLLVAFDELLLEIRDGNPPPQFIPRGRDPRLKAEFARPVRWGIQSSIGFDDEAHRDRVNKDEKVQIEARREHYDVASPESAIGLALSGGGIRSATFSLGVLISLAKRNLLPQIDYLSTVSGGGYLGAFLVTYLAGAPDDDTVGLRNDQLPFRRTDREAQAIGHIRQNSRYILSGTNWERLQIAFAQLFGLMVNLIAVICPIGLLALAEILLRRSVALHESPQFILIALGVVPIVVALLSLALMSLTMWAKRIADRIFALASLPIVLFMMWLGLGRLHEFFASVYRNTPMTTGLLLVGPFVVAGAAIAAARIFPRLSGLFQILAALSVPAFVFILYLAFYAVASSYEDPEMVAWFGFPLAGLILLLAATLDVNFTGLHRHYREKLAGVFLVRQSNSAGIERMVLKLSELANSVRAPYPLVNAALNVPSSRLPEMQGRLTDFFQFTPHHCGSPIVGYRETAAWESANAELDLGTAMAISGAAAAPQMGLASPGRIGFWMALLNIRLGYWLRQPKAPPRSIFGRPRLAYLLREMSGWMDEKSPHLFLTDGGHIENLGLFELLRRRCKYIIAIDGEQDPRMTFNALANLQRMASIDLGVTIDIDFDDLRLNERGLSRSHFKFSRIRYPGGEIGYLLYLKLSLTGNEGEFLRRYKMDEPDFPHHSTADQFFTEPQFEAYRSLGEHVGEKLFLRAIIGDLAESDTLKVGEWFARIGESFLEPEDATRQ